MFQDGSARLATIARGPGAPITRSAPAGAGSNRPTRRHRERSRRAGLTGRPGDPALKTRPKPRGQARPVVPSSVGRPAQPRPVCRLSDRPPRRGAGLAGGTPTGRPMPANPTGRGRRAREKCTRPSAEAPPDPAPRRPGVRRAAGTAPAALNLPGPICAALPFASRRLHVLLNSLFRVLFNFPSRYLCSIGLVQVFSLGWSLPPVFGLRYKTTRLMEALVRGRPAPAGA